MDITNAFQVDSLTVYDFFAQDRVGYNIPYYQRPYSWDTENIDQLMDDICTGLFDLFTHENNIHFMGTVITVENETFRKNITDPIQRSALPTRVKNIIDGQQRLSTIALLACCLYEKLSYLDLRLSHKKNNLEDATKNDLIEATKTYLNQLENLFSYNLQTRGTPTRKPIFIREGEDEWVLDDNEEDNSYKSDVSSFLVNFIWALYQEQNFPEVSKSNKLFDNINSIKEWLQDVAEAHIKDDKKFPSSEEIIKNINQEDFWDYPRTERYPLINDLIQNKDHDICTLIQLLAFSYYLLKCCCFTSIVPNSELRAFDMFQSLNATGTPLTALETFKPVLVNSITSKFNKSKLGKHFAKVEDLFSNLSAASSKNQRTDEYLSLFINSYNGNREKISKQFSKQRKWLMDTYEKLPSLEEQEKFIQKMGDVALYSKQIIYSDSVDRISNNIFNIAQQIKVEREDYNQAKAIEEATVCLLYLKDAKHKMAHTILSRFFSLVHNHKSSEYLEEFLSSCKAIAAFFTLWRSSLSKKYPDGEYRKLLQEEISWEDNQIVTAEELKKQLLKILLKNEIGDEESWISKATQNLRYSTSQSVCKFVLYITAENTIPDPDQPGLMQEGREGSTKQYLIPKKWSKSMELATIEHIAPQEGKGQGWDIDLYKEDDSYNKIGNLTLLPGKVNTSASNKGWIEKYIYYSYLAEKNHEKLIQF